MEMRESREPKSDLMASAILPDGGVKSLGGHSICQNMAWLIWPMLVLIDEGGGDRGLCVREHGKRGVGGREMKDEDPLTSTIL